VENDIFSHPARSLSSKYTKICGWAELWQQTHFGVFTQSEGKVMAAKVVEFLSKKI